MELYDGNLYNWISDKNLQHDWHLMGEWEKNTLGFDFLSTRSALTWSNQHCRVIFRDDCQRIVQAHSFCWVASPSRDQSDSHLWWHLPMPWKAATLRPTVTDAPGLTSWTWPYTHDLYLVQATIKWWIYRLHRRSTQYKVGTVTNYKWSELGPLEVGWNDASCRCSHL